MTSHNIDFCDHELEAFDFYNAPMSSQNDSNYETLWCHWAQAQDTQNETEGKE